MRHESTLGCKVSLKKQKKNTHENLVKADQCKIGFHIFFKHLPVYLQPHRCQPESIDFAYTKAYNNRDDIHRTAFDALDGKEKKNRIKIIASSIDGARATLAVAGPVSSIQPAWFPCKMDTYFSFGENSLLAIEWLLCGLHKCNRTAIRASNQAGTDG